MSKRKTFQAASPYPTRNRLGEKGNPITSDKSEETMMDSDPEIEINPQGSVTWAHLKEMLSSLKESINENTNKAIGAVKADVTEIKTQLEKYNDNLEEVQNRVGKVEDKVDKFNEDLEEVQEEVQTRMSQVEGKADKYREELEEVQDRVGRVEDNVGTINELKEEIAALKDEQKRTKDEREKEACRVRRNNIIINGIPGQSKDRKDVKKAFRDFILKGLELGQEWLEDIEVDEIYRFPGKKTDEGWPMFVRVSRIKYKEDMYKAAHNLKGKGFSMRNDLAPHLLKERSKLQVESRRLRAEPLNRKTKIRDTSFKVWMEVRKTDKDDWEPWDGLT